MNCSEVTIPSNALESILPSRLAVNSFHEFLPKRSEWDDSALTTFAGLVLAGFQSHQAHGQNIIWITQGDMAGANLSPSALESFGLNADTLIQISARNDAEALWAFEEVLNHPEPFAIVCELCTLNLQQSHRLNLRARHTAAGGQARMLFILRRNKGASMPVAAPTSCATRWRIGPAPSTNDSPSFHTTLFRNRGGAPGEWLLRWSPHTKTFMEIGAANND